MPAALYRRPFPGLVAFTIAFLSQWMGHTAWAFLKGSFGESYVYANLAVGAAGFAVVWRGLKQDELAATWMGLLGALMMWVGWFEFAFDYFAGLFAMPAWTAPTGLTVNAGSALLMSTAPLLAGLFLVYGFANRQTKCNFIRWFHRRLRLDPGPPTSGNGRSFARITAMETLFVIWFCYVFWLYAGFLAGNMLVSVIFVAWTGWAVYIFARLVRLPRVAHAVRYAIPVGGVSWAIVEMPSHMGLYPEIWLKPFDYPVVAVGALVVFVAGFVYVASPPDARRASGAARSA